MRPPSVIVVSGPVGSGKTTLAYAIARAVGCPMISRDEIKEGLVLSTPGYQPEPGDPLTRQTYEIFFDTLHLLLHAGVTVVAEAAFQDSAWRPGLQRLATVARIIVIRCVVDTAVAGGRAAHRNSRDPRRQTAHAPLTAEYAADLWQPISLDVPTLPVDTTDGYRPSLDAIITFIRDDQGTSSAREATAAQHD